MLLGVLATWAVGATVASACSYNFLSVPSPSSGPAGTQVRLAYHSNETSATAPVQFRLDSDAGSLIATGAGADISTTVTIPADLSPGTHAIVAVARNYETGAAVDAQETFEVTAPASSAGTSSPAPSTATAAGDSAPADQSPASTPAAQNPAGTPAAQSPAGTPVRRANPPQNKTIASKPAGAPKHTPARRGGRPAVGAPDSRQAVSGGSARAVSEGSGQAVFAGSVAPAGAGQAASSPPRARSSHDAGRQQRGGSRQASGLEDHPAGPGSRFGIGLGRMGIGLAAPSLTSAAGLEDPPAGPGSRLGIGLGLMGIGLAAPLAGFLIAEMRRRRERVGRGTHL